jgi:hypothetical protein
VGLPGASSVRARAAGSCAVGSLFRSSDGQQMYWCSLMYLRGGVRGEDVWREAGGLVWTAGGRSSKIRRCVTGVCCTAPTPFAALRISSDSFDANWNEWGFIRSGRAAHAAVSPRPAQSLYKFPSTCNTVVARAEGCTYAAKVWVWSLFCRPVPNPTRLIATNKSLDAGNQG